MLSPFKQRVAAVNCSGHLAVLVDCKPDVAALVLERVKAISLLENALTETVVVWATGV